jgi:small-conductance mechanosensitive channel
MLSLAYQTPPETCTALPDLLAGAINPIPKCSFVRCGLDNFAPSSLEFVLHYDLQVARVEDVIGLKNLVNMAILKLFAAHHIAFAYPTQTTYTAAPDGTMVMPYATPPSPNTNIIKRK